MSLIYSCRLPISLLEWQGVCLVYSNWFSSINLTSKFGLYDLYATEGRRVDVGLTPACAVDITFHMGLPSYMFYYIPFLLLDYMIYLIKMIVSEITDSAYSIIMKKTIRGLLSFCPVCKILCFTFSFVSLKKKNVAKLTFFLKQGLNCVSLAGLELNAGLKRKTFPKQERTILWSGIC